ncbi:MAG TPA: tyrosine-protein phosphatase [Sporichthya sp.]|nr:tyrosine-protein phosphatase [Sporichthya sp.]
MSGFSFERIFNLRDLGGLPTADGRTIRRGLVYRSDDPHLATAADVETLRALGISTVIDLRLDEEVGVRGSAVWDALEVIPVRCSTLTRPPVPENLAKYVDPEFIRVEYFSMLGSEEVAHRLWGALAAAGDRPRLIHCASGRDRTAIVVAFLLEALGVDREHVLDDYEASAPGMVRLLAHLDEHIPAAAAMSEGNRHSFVRTPRECMAAFLDAVDERWGSPVAYLEQLGVGTELKRLRADLLED